MSMSEKNVPIALLTQSGEPGRHLREALAAAGTPIAYEAHAAHFDLDELEKSGARVIVVNLDPDVDAHLEDVYSLLNDDRYNVIFNESQVSSQLSGWEQARWARHLAAKILGHENADPPRPAGAEAVPVREPTNRAVVEIPAAPIEQIAEVAVAHVLEDDVAQMLDAAPTASAPDEPEIIDFADLEHLFSAPTQTEASEVAAPAAGLDLSEFDAPDVAPANFDFNNAPETSESVVLASADSAHIANTDIESWEVSVSDSDNDEAIGFGDLDDFAGDSESGTDLNAFAEAPEVPFDLAADLAKSSAASSEATAGSSLSSLDLLDLDWADAPAVPAASDAPHLDSVPVDTPPPPALGSAFAWSLEDIDDGSAPPVPAENQPSAPADFGIEKISAADYLAPDSSDDAGAESFDSGLSLELIPLEDAVAPQQQTSPSLQTEAWLDPSSITVAVRRVWVLGASIGGPEAVREFLAQLPKDYPALFLLAQHMGAEFMALMAQQLVKTTALTVRTPTHGERVGHGDIVVVPTTHRLRVDVQGVILLEALAESDLAHSPSIDQLLHDVADRFGSNAGVIVFSGMAEDAVEGSRYLSAKGGKIYVQDPQTCVISSMVDGVLETGLVQFTGSPKELAERILDERRPT